MNTIHRIFYARFSALDLINNLKANQVEALTDLLRLDLISRAYPQQSAVAIDIKIFSSLRQHSQIIKIIE